MTSTPVDYEWFREEKTRPVTRPVGHVSKGVKWELWWEGLVLIHGIKCPTSSRSSDSTYVLEFGWFTLRGEGEKYRRERPTRLPTTSPVSEVDNVRILDDVVSPTPVRQRCDEGRYEPVSPRDFDR